MARRRLAHKVILSRLYQELQDHHVAGMQGAGQLKEHIEDKIEMLLKILREMVIPKEECPSVKKRLLKLKKDYPYGNCPC